MKRYRKRCTHNAGEASVGKTAAVDSAQLIFAGNDISMRWNLSRCDE
jgi:hypothetical protein